MSKFRTLGILILLALTMLGWVVLFVQNPVILAKARLRYLAAHFEKKDLSSGPCLGKIENDWVLDIAHLPREIIDELPENQCRQFLTGEVRHFVEMTPKGEIIVVY